MKSILIKGTLVVCAAMCMASCTGSKKQPSRIGKVIILKEGKQAGKDKGLHKGWYKNPNNPHHPNTTNPGHTKQAKGKAAKGGKAGKVVKGKK